MNLSLPVRQCLTAVLAIAATTASVSADETRPSAKKKEQPPVVHPQIGTRASSADGEIEIILADKRQYYLNGPSETRDRDIISPKSVHVSPDGSKFYVNSLEGARTVVYDARTHRKINVISHVIGAEHDSLWAPPTQLYTFRHDYGNERRFTGKPVESTFSHGGRYLWVPYYRRSFDINAQDPSAVAVIDTRTDKIVRLLDTGPLPKMIATSPDGKTIAVSHWGDNTIGIIDISSTDPSKWHNVTYYTVDHKLRLDFSLTKPVDRDNGSGNALRGTVFTPDGRYLLVGCMGGCGGIAVVDIKNGRYLGKILGMMPNLRHMLISGGYLYLSINSAGYVQRIPLQKILDTASNMDGRNVTLKGWSNCKVGAGARTIAATPDGRYILAACNSVSKLYVVDTRTMKVATSIEVDSYPVGLDISHDGRWAYVTSQGRDHKGGNCLTVYCLNRRSSANK